MAKTRRQVRKQSTHNLDLPCSDCRRTICPDELYVEVIYPSEQRAAQCSDCNPRARNLAHSGNVS